MSWEMRLWPALRPTKRLTATGCGCPKNHWALHLSSQYVRHSCLLATFVHERKHKVTKRYANARHNTCSYEKGLLEDVTCHDLHDVSSEFLKCGLLDPRSASKELTNVTWATVPLFSGQPIVTARAAQ
eukprot:6847406-Pyramimonas_sp.AAC.1